MKIEQKKEWLKKLKPFWSRRKKLFLEFSKKEEELRKKMCKKLGENLEFFYCDGECVGIGHEEFDKRKKFPLFHDNELE